MVSGLRAFACWEYLTKKHTHGLFVRRPAFYLYFFVVQHLLWCSNLSLTSLLLDLPHLSHPPPLPPPPPSIGSRTQNNCAGCCFTWTHRPFPMNSNESRLFTLEASARVRPCLRVGWKRFLKKYNRIKSNQDGGPTRRLKEPFSNLPALDWRQKAASRTRLNPVRRCRVAPNLHEATIKTAQYSVFNSLFNQTIWLFNQVRNPVSVQTPQRIAVKDCFEEPLLDCVTSYSRIVRYMKLYSDKPPDHILQVFEKSFNFLFFFKKKIVYRKTEVGLNNRWKKLNYSCL